MRCIKPNAALKPDSFEAPMTLHQLRWGGGGRHSSNNRGHLLGTIVQRHPLYLTPCTPCLRASACCFPWVCHPVCTPFRCCGVLEVARIARAGFPTRYTHGQFAERYAILLPGEEQEALLRGGGDGAKKVR